MVSSRAPWEWALPGLCVVFVIALIVRFGVGLPNPMATAWAPDGTPLESNGRVVELLGGTTITVAGAGAPVLAATRTRSGATARGLVVAGHVLGVLLAGHRWRVITANAGAVSWQDATSTVSAAPVLVIAVVAGVVGWFVSSHTGRSDGADPDRPG